MNPGNTTRIWDAVSATDPKHTKKVSVGARKFTAIDAHYQVHRATQLFGPLGIGWGWTTKFTHIGSKPSAIMAEVSLWYCDPAVEGSDCSSPVLGTGCSKYFDSKERFDPDAPKKAETDALTKALSRLGFNADVFLGQFDDNKYVREMEALHSKASPQIVSVAPQANDGQRQAPAPQAPPQPPQASPQRAPERSHHQRDNGYTVVSDEAVAKAALEPVAYSTGEPRWFADEIKFGKFKGRAWSEMVKGERGGQRHSWLCFMACDYDPYHGANGEETPEKYRFWNEVRVASAQSCLRWFDQHEAAQAAPAPAGGEEYGNPWDGDDNESPF